MKVPTTPTHSSKEKIERFLAGKLIKEILGTYDDSLSRNGDPQKKEPDVIYDVGIAIEVGGVLFGNNVRMDKKEKSFLDKLKDELSDNIPNSYEITLLFRENEDIVEYKPRVEYRQYKILAKYLWQIFISIKKDDEKNDGISFGSKSLIRKGTIPDKGIEIVGFSKELISFIKSIKYEDFQIKTHLDHVEVESRYEVCEVKLRVADIPSIDEFYKDLFGKKIMEKIRKNKYETTAAKKYLLLHNYENDDLSPTTNQIIYQLYRQALFALIKRYYEENDGMKKFDGLYFIDFSANRLIPCIFNILDEGKMAPFTVSR